MVATELERRPYGKRRAADGTLLPCSFEGCVKSVLARAMCQEHYVLWRRGAGEQPVYVLGTTECSIDRCERAGPYTRGYCRVHYGRLVRYGDPIYVAPPKNRRVRTALPPVAGATELAKILGVSRQRAQQLLTPEKDSARRQLASALKAGYISKAPLCSRCLEPSTKLHAHHWDYQRPLEVTWYCGLCHSAVHTAMRAQGLQPYPWQTRDARLELRLRLRSETPTSAPPSPAPRADDVKQPPAHTGGLSNPASANGA